MSEDATGHLFEQPTFNQGFVSVMIFSPSRVCSYWFDCLALKTQFTFAKLLRLRWL